MKRWFAKLSPLLLLAAALPLAAQDLASYEKRVYGQDPAQRPDRPPLAAAGSACVLVLHPWSTPARRRIRRTKPGLAHMMEHMAFKGTPDIGTTDYAAEKLALAKVEQTYAAYEAERTKRVGQDPQKLAAIEEGLAGRDQSRRQVRHQEPVRRRSSRATAVSA